MNRHSDSKDEQQHECMGFDGRRLHAVQIGLGTFGTVLENLAGKANERDSTVGWLLEATTPCSPARFRAVAVEPVKEHILRLQHHRAALPHVRLVEAAIGEIDAEGEVIHVLTAENYQNLLDSVAPEKQQDLKADLIYLRNMSCVGCPHPSLEANKRVIEERYGVDVVMETMSTAVWTYSTLAERFQFRGCELLLIDAEGHDTAILRSLINHCLASSTGRSDEWPSVIAFETLGHCDVKEGGDAEKDIVFQLQRHGYLVLLHGWPNTYLLYRTALQKSSNLRNWANRLRCDCCNGRTWPFRTIKRETYCRRCCVHSEH